MTKVLITGGGTAGHTNPGIAVAEALVRAGLETSDVHFVGGQRGNEGSLVPEAGFSIDLLDGRGIQRKISLAATKDNIRSVAGLMKGTAEGFRVVAAHKPNVVLCLGGYAAFAASAAAVTKRIPLVVTEQNARASAVNRLFGSRAAKCALPFPDTDLPNGEVTGNPIRHSIVEAVTSVEAATARRNIGNRLWPDNLAAAEGWDRVTDGEPERRTMVAVWSGSLGAKRVNAAVADLAEQWADRDDLVLYHIVGKRDWKIYGHPSPVIGARGLTYITVEYERHMADVLVAADFAVCRAGASTVAELAVAGLPAVLVPLPHAPRDHQRANTREMVEAGGAVLLEDAVVDGQKLSEVLTPLVIDSSRRVEMAEAVRSVARPNAADDVAKILLEVGGI